MENKIKLRVVCKKNYIALSFIHVLIFLEIFYKIKKLPNFISDMTIMSIYIDGELSNTIKIKDTINTLANG